jgi:hypothetical protein
MENKDSDLYQYLVEAQMSQLVPSSDECGDLCLAYTKLGVITIYADDSVISFYHQLETGDIYFTQFEGGAYHKDGVYEGIEIPVYTHF